MDLPVQSAAELIRKRYGRDEFSPPEFWNQTLSVILSHRSVRAYSPKKLPERTLETLIAAAQSAPTSSNLQTWSVVAVEDPERKARLAALAFNQKHIVQCPLFLVWVADHARLRHIGAERSKPTDGLYYLETFMVATMDATLAAQNCIIAAESLGLGTVCIGALRNHPEQVAGELGLPLGSYAVFGLCVGYADEVGTAGRDVKPRLPQEVVIHREQYKLPAQTAIASYDERLTAFQVEQQMQPIGWSEKALARVRGPEALHGRHVNRVVLNRLGFQMK